MRLTEEQRALYLAARGTHCPYCESESFGPQDYAIECNDCGERWINVEKDGKIINVQEA